MPRRVLAEQLAPHRDERGFVIEPLAGPALSAQRNVHVVWTTPGAIRGNHYHEHGTEVTLVVGPALIRYRDGTAPRDIRVPAGALWRVTFPPRVEHAYGAIGPVPMLLVGFNTQAHDPAAPDAVPVELLRPADLQT